MRKTIFTLTPVVVALLVSAGVAQAASNAQMTITATVEAATCDISLSNANLDLGNYTASDFSAVATPVGASVKTFTVGLSNCDTPVATGDTANLIVTGQTLGGNPNIFNSTGTNTGIMLSEVATPTAYITAGQKLNVATAGATPATGDFNAKSLSLQAALASTSMTPDIGLVSAPILFSFAYN
ncbi:fimbrial protein (plasmid) [Serratia sp. L9]|uniref:fimbrial protein n=1 Tax=Serratia sp. L9 TaxID=3423946 RepID=UPI003D672304